MSDDDARAQERIGTVLGDKWTLERLLGIGGMAAVYAARHRNGARAAVKVLHPGISRHEEVRERFLREGYAANRVEHPGCVKVLDDDVIATGPDAGTAFIVMELLEGESLQDRLERPPPLLEREFLRVAEQVLDVLDAAHGRGVIHRDLKPENLFLVRPEGASSPDGPRVKVLDFGLARLLDGQTITSHGLALGTPSFMAPEQAAGLIAQIDGRTDLFALGATGFRVRTGRRVHEAANAVELVGKMATLAAPPLREMASDVSAPFARVIDRALEFRREDRYADAAAMRDDVRRALAELDARPSASVAVAQESSPAAAPPSLGPEASSSTALPFEATPPVTDTGRRRALTASGRLVAGPSVVEPSDPTQLPVVQTSPWRRRRAWVRWIALGVLLGAGLGAVAMSERDRPEAPPPPTPPRAADVPPPPADPSPSATAAAKATATASTAPRAVVAPPATTTHAAASAAAPKVGPGNVHALPGKRGGKTR